MSIRFQADNDLKRIIVDATLLVSHDKRKMPLRLAQFVFRGGESPGVLLSFPSKRQSGSSRIEDACRDHAPRRCAGSWALFLLRKCAGQIEFSGSYQLSEREK